DNFYQLLFRIMGMIPISITKDKFIIKLCAVAIKSFVFKPFWDIVNAVENINRIGINFNVRTVAIAFHVSGDRSIIKLDRYSIQAKTSCRPSPEVIKL